MAASRRMGRYRTWMVEAVREDEEDDEDVNVNVAAARIVSQATREQRGPTADEEAPDEA